jgi:tetratricopeptide (TPR) repeat protein
MTTPADPPPPTPPQPAEVDRQLQARDNDRVFQAAGDQYIIEHPAASHPPVAVANTLPRDTAAFTGRADELRTLREAIVQSADSTKVIAIHAIDGMPGVGKTALAVHAGHLLADRFPDGQLFVDLHAHTANRGPVNPTDVLFALLSGDGMHPEKIPAELDARAAQWRARMAGKRVLMVMDNAEGHAQVEPLLPGTAGCLVLVTSRRRLTGLSARHTTVTLALDNLSPDQAAELFIRLIGRHLADNETQAVDELVRLCGYLPLAISLLAARLRPERLWKVTDLVTDLADAQDRLAQMYAEDIAVRAAFDMSYSKLPAARQRFFRRLGLHPGTEIDAYAGAALDGITVADSRRHLEALYEDHLLDQPVRGRYRLHDLIGEYARTCLAEEPQADRDQATTRVLDYYQCAASIANQFIDPRAAIAAREPVDQRVPLPAFVNADQAVAWLRREIENLFGCVTYARTHDLPARIVGLSVALAAFLGRTGRWQQGIVLHSMAALAARESGDQAIQARALYSRGVLLRRTGDYAGAIAVVGEALYIYQQLRDLHGTADVLNELGTIHRLTGRCPEAATILERALVIYQETNDPLGRARTLDKLAAVRWLTDDCPGAAEALEEALAIYADHDEPWGRTQVLFDLGVVRRMTCDYAAARRSLQEALAVYEGLGDRLGQANAQHNLGVVRWMTADYLGATQALEEAFATYQDLGNRHGQANTFKHLGIVRSLTDDLPGAAIALQQSLTIYTTLGDQLGRAAALQHLGEVKRLAGNLAAAAQDLEQALILYRTLDNRLGEAEVLNYTGVLLLDCGDAPVALSHHRLALRLAREVHSLLEEAHALDGAAQCALYEHDADSAAVHLSQAVQIYERIGTAEATRAAAQLAELSPPQRTDKWGAAA